VLAGGYFNRIGSQPRRYIAALDTATGAPTSWNPDADWPVFTLARSDSTVYVGGFFSSMGGQPRHSIAAVDAATGNVTPWNPDASGGWINTLLVNGNTVYAGGWFDHIGGAPRQALAAVSATSAEATPWDPSPGGWDTFGARINGLVLNGSQMYVGGDFGSIGGQSRICLAAVDTVTGRAAAWDPGLDGIVWSLAGYGNTIYVGGGFTRMSGLPCGGLAAFVPAPPLAAARAPRPTESGGEPARLALDVPNPAYKSASIRLGLPSPTMATLRVYDLQGRRVADLLDRALLPVGVHTVPLHTQGWPAGIYFCRLELDRQVITRKFVVTK
jgi:hypothetical protein